MLELILPIGKCGFSFSDISLRIVCVVFRLVLEIMLSLNLSLIIWPFGFLTFLFHTEFGFDTPDDFRSGSETRTTCVDRVN